MRDKISVFYYPDFYAKPATFLKAILLFDELHFMDREAMTFGKGGGTRAGTIGAASPLRQVESAIRNEGVPFFVHGPPLGGLVEDERYEQIKADVNDPEFLRRFQSGLKTSATFRDLQIAKGNYGASGDQDSVAGSLIAVDLSAALKNYEGPIALFEDSDIRLMDTSTPVGCAKDLIFQAVICSAKLNFALSVGAEEGFFPLADARPYGDLLGAKYARAINALEPQKNNLQITDLSFAIFDELVSEERLTQLTLRDVIRYRKASEKAREEFLEHLSVIQAKQARIGADGDYAGAVSRLIETEIRPAVRTFKNKLRTIDEALFGAIAKGAVGALAGLTIFGDLSWPKIIGIAGTAVGYVTNAAIEAILAERAAKRECSISYILSLDE
ncbi:MAG: hypothetical protein ABSG13_08285 [Bryobacteraceae bacterium]|jgi:hypothetical protein